MTTVDPARSVSGWGWLTDGYGWVTPAPVREVVEWQIRTALWTLHPDHSPAFHVRVEPVRGVDPPQLLIAAYPVATGDDLTPYAAVLQTLPGRVGDVEVIRGGDVARNGLRSQVRARMLRSWAPARVG